MNIFNRKKKYDTPCSLGRHNWDARVLDNLSDTTLYVARDELPDLIKLKHGNDGSYVFKNPLEPTIGRAKLYITDKPYETKSPYYLTCHECSCKVYLGKAVKRNKYY